MKTGKRSESYAYPYSVLNIVLLGCTIQQKLYKSSMRHQHAYFIIISLTAVVGTVKAPQVASITVSDSLKWKTQPFDYCDSSGIILMMYFFRCIHKGCKEFYYVQGYCSICIMLSFLRSSSISLCTSIRPSVYCCSKSLVSSSSKLSCVSVRIYTLSEKLW